MRSVRSAATTFFGRGRPDALRDWVRPRCYAHRMSMKVRVLIVEDHADSAEFLRVLLEPEGCLVQTAATGKQAREIVMASHPDIILMDLVLPDVEGLDLLR